LTINVIKPGLFTTVQDLGRYGFAHLGISPAGAADALSLRIANLLVGNDENAPALEMTLLGATLTFEESVTVAITGAACECKLGPYTVPVNQAVEILPGSVLQCGSTTGGARCYIAIRGGFEVPLIMGSASTDVRGNFGGVEGRRLRKGDMLRVGEPRTRPPGRLRGEVSGMLRGAGPVRVTRGAQCDWFNPDACAKFFGTSYLVSEQSDRAGLRLQGEAISPRDKRQLLSDGIPLGAVQVPHDGQPIILFVDQQTTGGYPKIASVIAADMHRIGQLRPREEVRFAEVSIAEAVEALRAQERWLKDVFVASYDEYRFAERGKYK
jgi:antagonist of KipI